MFVVAVVRVAVGPEREVEAVAVGWDQYGQVTG